MGSSMSTAHSREHVPDDALGEVLVRVPPHPATLARASLACKRLHCFIGGAGFQRTFQARHRSTRPPLLGFFHDDQNLPRNFLPIGDSPDRVSAAEFDPKEGLGWRVVDSRHGRVLLRSPDRARFLVWDPAAGRRRYIDVPPAMMMQHADGYNNAAVVCACACAAPGPGHVDHPRADCHDCPFSVVFVAAPNPDCCSAPDASGTTVVYLYSSELELWNEVASADLWSWIRISDRPVALVRNVLYWTMVRHNSWLQSSILAFDLQTRMLYQIEQPVYNFDAEQENVQVMETEEEYGMLGLVAACGLTLQLWVLREYNGRPGTERWSMSTQIELYGLALGDPMDPTEEFYMDMVWILSVEGSRLVFVRTEAGIFEVDLSTEVPNNNRRICDAYDIQVFYPYKSFYYRGT